MTDEIGAGVARQQDQRVAEVDDTPLAILHPAFVEDLVEQFVHVGMGLFSLIKQDHAVGSTPDGLCQHPTLAITDVARRRALETGDGVCLLVLTHVDGDEVVLAAVDGLGQRQGGFGLADPGRSHQQEGPQWLAGIAESGLGGLDTCGDRFQRAILTDHPLAQLLFERKDGCDVVLHHPTRRNAGPVCDDGGDDRLVHLTVNAGALTLKRRETLLQVTQFALHGAFFARIAGLTAGHALLKDGAGEKPLRIACIGQCRALLPCLIQSHLQFRQGVSAILSHAGFVLQKTEFRLQRVPPCASSLQLPRRRMQRHGDPCASGVQQTDRLVGELARGNVAVGQRDGSTYGLVEHDHAVVLRKYRDQAPHHCHGVHLRGLLHLQHLKAPGQRRVSLDVLLVLGPRGGTDDTHRSARQCRLEQVGGIARARLSTRTHQGMNLVDEQDDWNRRITGLLEHGLEAGFELAPHAGAGKQRPDVQTQDSRFPQTRRNLTGSDGQGQTLRHGGLANSSLAREQRIILATSQQDVRHRANLLFPPHHRIDAAIAGERREIRAISGQCRAALCRCAQGTAGFTRDRWAQIRGVVRRHVRLARFPDDRQQFVAGERDGDLLEACGDVQQQTPQLRCLKHRTQQPCATYLPVAHRQACKDPGTFDGQLNHVAEVIETDSPAGQLRQRYREIPLDLAVIQAVMRGQTMEIVVGDLPDLVEPMNQFYIGVASQFGKGGS